MEEKNIFWFSSIKETVSHLTEANIFEMFIINQKLNLKETNEKPSVLLYPYLKPFLF